MAIKIVVDSSIDLNDEILKTLDVEVVPLTVSFGDDSYLDRVELTPEEFYERMGREKELPKTAQPAPGRFLEIFEKHGKNGDKILCLCLSSKLSGTYNSAILAKSMTDYDIEVIDTQSGSAGIGILTYLANKWVNLGKSFSEVADEVRAYAEKLSVYALLDTVENAVKGGRLSPLKGALATILNLKIVCQVNQGRVELFDKIRGAKLAYKKLLTLFEEKAKGRSIPVIGIAHVANEKGARMLKELLQKVHKDAEIFITTMGATIGTYAGPGGIVLAF